MEEIMLQGHFKPSAWIMSLCINTNIQENEDVVPRFRKYLVKEAQEPMFLSRKSSGYEKMQISCFLFYLQLASFCLFSKSTSCDPRT